MSRQILQREKYAPLLLQTKAGHRARGASLPTCLQELPWSARWRHYPCVAPTAQRSQGALQEVAQVQEPFVKETRRASNE